MNDSLPLGDLCAAVRELTRETGVYIQEARRQLSSESIHLKGRSDFVTDVDRGSEERLIAGLKQILPQAGYLAEEGTVAPSDQEYTWVIDPIDGTTNFIHGIPIYGISIALTRGAESILGVVHELNQDECFYTWKGESTYLNGTAVEVSANSQLNEGLVATGFPYRSLGKEDKYLAIFKDFMGSSRGLRRLGSAAVDLAYVACGRFDGFYEYNLNPWDVAAGTLLVQQAGGQVSDFLGGNGYRSGTEVMATNGHLHAAFREIIARHFC